ncbi:GNAT family N-acetyltransferase [Cesiribacter andamanensis]|uniref:Ribosomal-protein-serine acetyltransferase n=1 Tax=Cesiribacter andamanensis AMV16 TaxID=1279009 RepID=M7NRB9_9BACT|nr:GNAT family N-acetyltransferase [Cesiribacter andamanensis]EMR04250.1 Ribosomal-protein-serine acetyltransferase [Cesiribacter andamanensis AMV16]
MSLFPLLSTPRLQLRQFRPEDVQLVFQGLSHPEVIRYYGVSYKTLEDTQAQMQWFRELEEGGTGVWWAICSAKDGAFWGAIGYNNLSREHRKAELGFWLLPDYWRRGVVSEALPPVLTHGFNQMGLHRIEALVESENRASKQCLLKAGFRHEGCLRDCEIKGGRFISLDVLARLATD